MNHNWVVNASPLIVLGKIDQLRLLRSLASSLIIPESVRHEVTAGPPQNPAAGWLRGEGQQWIAPDVPADSEVLGWDLGSGETSVLSYAKQHREFEAIVDDRAARRCATVFHISARGSLGVLIAAKKRLLIPSLRATCNQLLGAGLHVDPVLVKKALSLVGE